MRGHERDRDEPRTLQINIIFETQLFKRNLTNPEFEIQFPPERVPENLQGWVIHGFYFETRWALNIIAGNKYRPKAGNKLKESVETS